MLYNQGEHWSPLAVGFVSTNKSYQICQCSSHYFGETTVINTPETPVGRATKKELSTIATVLNNCAHSRTFNISKTQLVQYQAFVVIAVQELMGLWDVKVSS
jgi:hypothetical protein